MVYMIRYNVNNEEHFRDFIIEDYFENLMIMLFLLKLQQIFIYLFL